MNALLAYRTWSWLLLLLPIYFVVFYNLGGFHLRLWDESYFAVQAYEMLQHHSWIVTYFEGAPENMGSKPPLQLWLQMFSIQAFGLSVWALRLPSALAAAATILLVFFFVRDQFNEGAAWVASLVLLTTGGFIHFHTGRGMEADALLALCTFLQVIWFWKYLESHRPRFMVLFGLITGIAFLVKSVAAYLFIPGIAVYLLIFRRDTLMNILRSKATYAGLALALGLPIAYLLIREYLQPGHWEFMLERHVGRFGNDLGVFHSRIHYFSLWATEHFSRWLPLAIMASVWAVISDRDEHRLTRYLSVVTLTFVIFLSLADTKYDHYLNPSHPLVAIMVASLVYPLMQSLSAKHMTLLLFAGFALPLFGMYQKAKENTIPKGEARLEASEAYLHASINQGKNHDGLLVLHEGFVGALRFYEHRLRTLDQNITITDELKFEPGNLVLTSIAGHQQDIERIFDVEIVDQLDNAIVYHIKAIRNE